jgi:hypothetical protein
MPSVLALFRQAALPLLGSLSLALCSAVEPFPLTVALAISGPPFTVAGPAAQGAFVGGNVRGIVILFTGPGCQPTAFPFSKVRVGDAGADRYP